MADLKYATEENLKGQGFPKLFQEAFLRTADEVQSVVLCRAPGGATTRIIEENYDLKAFFVKAKSCNWGPMQGFLCQVPILSKKGLQGIEYNTREMLHYFDIFDDRVNLPSELTVGTPQLSLPDRIEKIVKSASLKVNDFIPGVTWDNFKKKSRIDLSKFLKHSNEEIYVSLLKKQADEPTKRKLDNALTELRQIDLGAASPFVPLAISSARLEEIKSDKESMPKEYRIQVGSDFYGIAFHKWPGSQEIDIVMDYLIKKVGSRYELYFCEILHRGYQLNENDEFELKNSPTWGTFPGGTDFSKLFPKLKKLKGEKTNAEEVKAIDKEVLAWKSDDAVARLFPKDPKEKLQPHNFNNAELTSIAKVREDFCSVCKIDIALFKNKPKEGMYPIRGLQNYYPPYSGDDSYKNAVTGDYDLFAIWPRQNFGLRELTRQSEIQLSEANDEADAPLFNRVSEKAFTLQSTVSPNIYVEFIPGFAEITGKEHLSFGNFSSLGTLCAGTLNSYVAVARKKLGKTSPNAAFHSDEGGRPGIDDVEYPVAVFLPQALADVVEGSRDKNGKTKKSTNRRLLLDNNDQGSGHYKFLNLILALKGKCFVPLNFVWLHDMLTYAYREGAYAGKKENSNEDKVSKDAASQVKERLITLFIKPKRKDEINFAERQEGDLKRLKDRFVAIFTRDSKGKKSAEKIAYVLNGPAPVPTRRGSI